MENQLVRRIAQTAYQYREEPFTLASGMQSHEYIDAKKLLMNSWNLKTYAYWVGCRMEEEKVYFVAGPSIGGALLAGAIVALHGAEFRPCYGIIAREKRKNHGVQKRLEGVVPSAGEKVMIVEDVITTGDSALTAAKLIEKSYGAQVVGVCTLVDREEDGSWNLSQAGYPLHAYTTLSAIRKAYRELDPAYPE